MDSSGIIATANSIGTGHDGHEVLVGVPRHGEGAVGALEAAHADGMLNKAVLAVGAENRCIGMRAKPTPAASTASSRLVASAVRASRPPSPRPGASAAAPTQHLGHPSGQRAQGHAFLLAAVPDHQGHVPLGQVPWADLHPDRNTLELPGHAAPATKLVSVRSSRRTRWPAATSSATSAPAACPTSGASFTISTTTRAGASAGAKRETEVVAVAHHQRPDKTGRGSNT